jgi:hypothetical protein
MEPKANLFLCLQRFFESFFSSLPEQDVKFAEHGEQPSFGSFLEWCVVGAQEKNARGHLWLAGVIMNEV